ncbi:MAG: hypothetical protein HQK56_10150 [Deltaproteobacteria bacterium]|nr:hypothetical protein [Deltaproteobacteria bacterium]
MTDIDSALKAIESAPNRDGLSDSLIALEREIRSILLAITFCEEAEDANDYFQTLDQVQTVLARLVFKKGLRVTHNLTEFVRDFDRIDDADLRRHLFSKIKDGEYFLLQAT